MVVSPEIVEKDLLSLSDEERDRYDACSHEWKEISPFHPVYESRMVGGRLMTGVFEIVERTLRCLKCCFIFSDVRNASSLSDKD